MTPEEKRLRGAQLYRAGISQQDIAHELGVSENTVTNWKRRYGWGESYQRGRDQKRREKAFGFYRDGMSQQEIGRLLGASENTITAWKQRGEWEQRLAVMHNTNTRNDLIQLGKLVEAKLLIYASDNRRKHAGVLRRAYANVSRLLEHADLAEQYAPGEHTESEPDATP